MPEEPKSILEQILTSLGFDAAVEDQALENGHLLQIQAEDAGRLIGRQGRTLGQLQYLVNRILFQQDPQTPKVTVDVGGYRAAAREAIVKKALDAVERVRRWGDIVELEPLNAFERHIVHQALKDNETVEVHSVEVKGSHKKAIILRPKN